MTKCTTSLQLGTKMNWLDFEVKRSKVKFTHNIFRKCTFQHAELPSDGSASKTIKCNRRETKEPSIHIYGFKFGSSSVRSRPRSSSCLWRDRRAQRCYQAVPACNVDGDESVIARTAWGPNDPNHYKTVWSLSLWHEQEATVLIYYPFYRVGQKLDHIYEFVTPVSSDAERRVFRLFSSLSRVRLVFWISPHLSILCTSWQKLYYTENID